LLFINPLFEFDRLPIYIRIPFNTRGWYELKRGSSFNFYINISSSALLTEELSFFSVLYLEALFGLKVEFNFYFDLVFLAVLRR